MSTIQTLIFDAVDAYLAAHRNAWPDLEEQGLIFDGPQVKAATDLTFAVVGSDDPTSGGFQVVMDSGTQDWESLGAGAKVESFVIWSTLVLWVGDRDPANFVGLRADAKQRLSDLAAQLRPTPSGIGTVTLLDVLSQGRTGWCNLAITRMRSSQDPNGSNLHVQYSLTCTAYI